MIQIFRDVAHVTKIWNFFNDIWLVIVQFGMTCGKVYPVENDQNKILCAIDWCNDQMACKKRHALCFALLVNPMTLMSRFIKRGSEHMYRRYWEVPIGNTCTFPLRRTAQIPERLKKFLLFIKSLKKTCLGSHRSEKREFLGQIQRKKPTFVIGNSNQPSHMKNTLTRPGKGLVLSPPCGT